MTTETPRTMNRDETHGSIREAILSALDDWAATMFAGNPNLGREPGASDQDLSHLFPAIDGQLARLCERFGVTLED